MDVFLDPDKAFQRVTQSHATWERIRTLSAAPTAKNAAANLSTLRATYPTMRGGVALPLAQANILPDDPVAQEINNRELKRNRGKRGFWGSLGDVAFAPVNLAYKNVIDPVGDVAFAALKPIVRTGTMALMAPFEEAVGLGRNIATALPDIAEEVVGGALSGAAVGGAIGAAGFNPVTIAGGVIGGAVAGGVAGGVARARGVDVKGAPQWGTSQSTLGAALGGASPGKGFLPGGKAYELQAERARKAASINGHAVTPGRLLAGAVAEPGTTPYNWASGLLDLSVAWKGDPAAYGLAKYAKARKEVKAFQRAGIFRKGERIVEEATQNDKNAIGVVEGTRNTVITKNVERWLNSRTGASVRRKIAEEKEFETIRRIFPKADMEAIISLTNADTAEQVGAILQSRLGIQAGFKAAPDMGKGVTFMRNLQSRSRLAHDMPSGKLDIGLKDGGAAAMEQTNLLQINMGLDYATIAKNQKAMGEALARGDTYGVWEARRVFLEQMVGGKEGFLTSRAGFLPDLTNKLISRMQKNEEMMRQFLVNEDGNMQRVPGLTMFGKDHPLPMPSLMLDSLENVIEFDARTIRDMRRAGSKFGKLLVEKGYSIPGMKTAHGVATGSVAGADFLMNDIWKPMALLRGAWAVRVIGEEQIRMAAVGLSSTFSHPIEHLSWLAAGDGKLSEFLKKMPGIEARGAIDLEGNVQTLLPTDFDDQLNGIFNQYASAQSTRHGASDWFNKTTIRDVNQQTYKPGMEGFEEAWAEEILNMNLSPIHRQLAAGTPLTGKASVVEPILQRVPEVPTKPGRFVDVKTGRTTQRKVPMVPFTEIESVERGAYFVQSAAKGKRITKKRSYYQIIRNKVDRWEVTLPGAKKPIHTFDDFDEARTFVGGHRSLGEDVYFERGSAKIPGRVEEVGTTARPPANMNEWLMHGEGKAFRERVMQESGRGDTFDDVNEMLGVAQRRLMNGVAGKESTATQSLDMPGLAGMGRAGNADGRLLEAVATGQLDGIPIRLPNGKVNREFVNKLKAIAEEGVVPESLRGRRLRTAKLGERRDKVMDFWFSNLMAKPSSVLSRSPAFRQFLWREGHDLITEMAPDAQQALIANARKANMLPRDIKKMIDQAARSSGEMTLAEANMLAKGRALDSVKDLLYETSKRGQASDSLRLLFPFMEAQKEVMTRWATIISENPQVTRRAGQIVQGARGAGIFYKDDQTNEEMFAFPGSGFLTEKTLGMRIPLAGPVKGLSMFGSGVMPGVGPVVQMPMRWFVPDTPKFDDLKGFLDPFGQMAEEEQGLVEGMLPSWFNKIRRGVNAEDTDRQFANATFEIWRSGVSSGKWGTETQEEMTAGLESAKQKASALFWIRGAASLFGAPVAPTPEFVAMDKEGRWLTVDKIVEDYRKIQDENPDNANEIFLDRYGENAFTYMQAKTYTPGVSAPSGKDTAQWIKAHPDLVKDYPRAYGLFAPQEEDLDYPTYLRQLETGERISLTAEQAANQANDRVAKMQYYNVKDNFGPYPSKKQNQFLAAYRDALRKDYPGAWEHLDLVDKVKPSDAERWSDLLGEVRGLANDPEIADTPLGEAVTTYLKVRETLNQKAQALGVKSFTQAKKTAPLRAWVRQYAEVVMEETPEFRVIWERLFDRELKQDETVEEEAVA